MILQTTIVQEGTAGLKDLAPLYSPASPYFYGAILILLVAGFGIFVWLYVKQGQRREKFSDNFLESQKEGIKILGEVKSEISLTKLEIAGVKEETRKTADNTERIRHDLVEAEKKWIQTETTLKHVQEKLGDHGVRLEKLEVKVIQNK